MALEDIFRALEEQADRDIEAVLAEANEHARAILDEAKRDAEALRDNRIAEADQSAHQHGMQTINTVRLEARKTIAAAKERAVAAVFEQARLVIADARSGSDYPQVFRGLLDEAVDGVEGAFEVLVDSADVELARSVLAQKGIDARVSGEIATAGGVVVALEGRRVLRRNTLEDRLEKLQAAAQADVAEMLFA